MIGRVFARENRFPLGGSLVRQTMWPRLLAPLALLALSAGVLFSCVPGPVAEDPPEALSPVEVSVTRVTDGDTVRVRPAVEGEEDVRFIGVDTPEKYGPDGAEPLADEATDFTTASIEDAGGRVTLRFDVEDKDDYGRVLAYVYLPDGTMLNEDLVEQGYAQVATFPPNVRHREEFERAQGRARDDRRGIWGLPAEDLCRLADRGNGIGGC